MSEKSKDFTVPLVCRHCGNVAPMSYLARAFDARTKERDATDPFESGTGYELLKCPSCSKCTLRSYYWDDFIDGSEVEFELLYPIDSKVPPGLPADIEKAFRSAIKVRAIDANAFGVLIGRTIEMVCRDRGAEGQFLSHKLRDLAQKGEIPDKLADVAGKLARLRNVGAHADLGELTAVEVPVIEDLCRALLDYIYAAPFLTARAEERLSKLSEK